jgi:nitroreductase
MDFFDVVNSRRSIRRFLPEAVPAQVIERALDAAIKAPNSSNTQTWNFYWLRTPHIRAKAVEICFSQSAARTAQELIVVTADPALWRRSQKPIVEYVKSVKAPSQVLLYYEKLIPFVYRWGFFNLYAPLKWIVATIVGLWRPMQRGVFTRRDLQEVSIKSAALACENFVLALTAQGYASCMMEGFDECRLSRLLKLKSSERVVMVIGVGKEAPQATWGPQFRIPKDQVVHRI